jgi:hypothetical protein
MFPNSLRNISLPKSLNKRRCFKCLWMLLLKVWCRVGRKAACSGRKRNEPRLFLHLPHTTLATTISLQHLSSNIFIAESVTRRFFFLQPTHHVLLLTSPDIQLRHILPVRLHRKYPSRVPGEAHERASDLSSCAPRRYIPRDICSSRCRRFGE